MSAGLQGIGVLVTRPADSAAELADAITSAGGVAVQFPVLEVETRDSAIMIEEQAKLPAPDIAIFVSANAVRFGLEFVPVQGVRLAAIGPATRAAIEEAGRGVDICPAAGFTSEQLLEEPELRQVAGKAIRIVRADSGRELLASTLRERGARVDYLSAYRRLAKRHTDDELKDLEQKWRDLAIQYVTVLSVETLESLLSSLPEYCRAALPETTLVTPSERVIQTASERIPGIRAILSPGPQAGDMVRAIVTARENTT